MRLASRSVVLAVIACFVALQEAWPQSGQPGAAVTQEHPPPPASSVSCDAFRRNDNGMWSLTREITITTNSGSISLGPGASFGPGVRFLGIDLYSLLEQYCR